MKIVQVLGGAEDGGLEKHVIELTHSLKQSNIETSIIAHKKFKKDFVGINFIELDLSKGRNNPFVLYKLYKILKKEQFDIIHTQANKATDMVIKLKPFLKAKVISTLHGYKKNIKSFEKSDFVITVSDRIGVKLKNPNKETIYNGVHLEDIKDIDLHKKYNIPKDSFIVCAIGRFAEVKGFDILTKAMGLVKKNIRLILVGDGDEEIRESAQKCKNITITGYLGSSETQEILKSSNLCVITSKREGFSYVFAESLVLKTPLISTDVADIKRFIPQKFIVKSDAKDIADKIESFYENYRENLALYESAFEKAMEDFSIKTMTKRVISRYKRVLDGL